MMRRDWMVATGCGAGFSALGGCTSRSDHERAALGLRRPFDGKPADRMLLERELVRYATLAPSSHNTQCWRFGLQQRSITIEPDFARRCPVVDPDDHHLFVSLGCATENLVHAALANGFRAEPRFDSTGPGVIAIELEPAQPQASPLYLAIADRQCTRGDYDSQPLSTAELRLLEQASIGKGVHAVLLSERQAKEKVLEYVTMGNTSQLNDPAFVKELKKWIRFSDAEAVRTGDGLFSGASGSPAVPRWLGGPMLSLFLTPKSDNERYARQVRNAAGLAVFVSESDDKAHWVEVGRCYERFALQATALGIRNAFLNQAVEVGSIRSQFASALGLGNGRPDLVVRFGRGPILPSSMRRPVHDVLS